MRKRPHGVEADILLTDWNALEAQSVSRKFLLMSKDSLAMAEVEAIIREAIPIGPATEAN